MKKLYFLLIFLFCSRLAHTQIKSFPINGIASKEKELIYTAFTHVTIYTDYQTILHDATMLIYNGKIMEVGNEIKLPQGTIIYDLKGKYIYPSFIDLDSQYGMPVIQKATTKNAPQYQTSKDGAFSWNQALKPEIDASTQFTVDAKQAEEYRKTGFGSVLTFQHDGISRGTSTLVSLAEGKENELILINHASANYSFNKGSSSQSYPTSQMGTIALLRQTYYDAQWYSPSPTLPKGKGEKARPNNGLEVNLSLEAWLNSQSLPQIFEVNSQLEALRADKIGDEFGIQYIIKGSGDEYKRIEEIRNTNAAFIIPLNFPKVYEIEDVYDAKNISLSDMKHWEMAPSNPAILEENNVPFAISPSGLEKKVDFLKNIRKAIKNGLSQTQALKAVTFTPAQLIHADAFIGSLKKGMLANFIITSDSVFKEKTILYENWVQGKKYIINDYNTPDIRGTYDLLVDNKKYILNIKGEVQEPKASIIVHDTVNVPATIVLKRNLITLNLVPHKDSVQQTTRLSGYIDFNNTSTLKGSGELFNGDTIKWHAHITSSFEETKKDSAKTKIKETEMGKVYYPFTAFGSEVFQHPQTILIKNATVWTNEETGIISNTDVLIHNGKVAGIGKNLGVPADTKTIDGTGKHLTPGIIDEHSHIAISSGVNEQGQYITAEVRIGDVINSEDINIYRQLAGGVTTSQLLHGSSNPIGGQSALIKLRWGQSPEKMKFEGSDGFIKFALGENVKQSNWGDNFTIRYPQTRMGVEQTYYDAFIRAKEYEKEWAQFNLLSTTKKQLATTPRKDLELETLVEILNKKRFITCHSYVQSEINMLMHVGDSMGFKVNTFTHILEGYKVADKMKARGIGGSTFSDWWAYKFEVYEAIPYNAAILNKIGVVTAINSDDAEMGRRLNQEAAKTIKYGGLTEEEALKLVTLNPAKLLHIDNKVGSIKIGKDADVVLWSDNPLSIYAKAEKTFVDGICYYDIEKDLQTREAIQKERARLIQKMLVAKKNGEPTQKVEKKEEVNYHCEF